MGLSRRGKSNIFHSWTGHRWGWEWADQVEEVGKIRLRDGMQGETSEIERHLRDGMET